MRPGIAPSRRRRRAALGGAAGLLLALGMALGMASGAVPGFAAGTALAAGEAGGSSSGSSSGSGRVPVPRPAVERGTQCIAPKAEMRRTHMDLLRHQRDRTLRDGVRGAKVSLNGCVECHATPAGAAGARSVVGSADAFCQGCHQYAGITLDCFECHQPKAAARPGAGGGSGR